MKKIMWKQNAVWALFVLCAAAMYLFENNTATRIVLCSVIFIPVGMIVVARIAVARIGAELEIDGQETIRVTIKNSRLLPAVQVLHEVECRNLLTGETASMCIRGKNPQLTLRVRHCGKISIRLKRIIVQDVFALTEYSVPSRAQCTRVIWPQTFQTEVVVRDDSAVFPDSDQYSPAKPGSDPSETFNLREYIPGDPVKSIAWKLSQKTDNLFVREYGLPVANQMLLLLETAVLKDGGAVLPAQVDAMVTVFASVSLALAEKGVLHTIGWRDRKTGALITMEIRAQEDTAAALERVLGNTVSAGDVSVTGCFSGCPYPHVAVVTPYVTPDSTKVFSGSQITMLLAGENDGSVQSGDMSIVPFSQEGYKYELRNLEL